LTKALFQAILLLFATYACDRRHMGLSHLNSWWLHALPSLSEIAIPFREVWNHYLFGSPMIDVASSSTRTCNYLVGTCSETMARSPFESSSSGVLGKLRYKLMMRMLLPGDLPSTLSRKARNRLHSILVHNFHTIFDSYSSNSSVTESTYLKLTEL